MTAVEAVALAEHMLKLNDPYEVARLLVELEGKAKIAGMHEFAEALKTKGDEGVAPNEQ